MKAKACDGCSAYFLVENLVGGYCSSCRQKRHKQSSARNALAEKQSRLEQRERAFRRKESEFKEKEAALKGKENITKRNFQILQDAQAALEAESKSLKKAQDRTTRHLATIKQKNRQESEQLKAEKQRLSKELKTIQRREKQLDKKEQALARRADKLKQLSPTQKKLRADLTKSLRATERAKNRAANLQSKLDHWARYGRIIEWMQADLGDGSLWPHQEPVVIIGEDPYTRQRFTRYLKGCQFETAKAGSADARLMVVGRDGWSESALERQIQARQGEELRVYSQELFLMTIALSRDPLEECGHEDLIELFGSEHPALAYLIRSKLEWPQTMPSRLSDQLIDNWGVEESPLHMLGYRVGSTSKLSTQGRRAILKQGFERDTLPPVHSDEYMWEWGQAKSARRLWRMAHHVASLARRRDPAKKVATSHWSSDLQWMKKNLFKPWMKFRWPSTRVP